MEEKNISFDFKEFVEQTNCEIKNEAILERAFSDKITIETINDKVNSEINSINYGIKKINSKFTQKSKNYNLVKEQIEASMEKYENSLKQLGEFYDGKIEQLIIRKFELQTNLVGKIITYQYLIDRINEKNNAKKESKIKNILTNGIKKAIEKIKEIKKKEIVDVSVINKLKDKQEIENEQNLKLEDSIEKIEENIKLIKENIEKIEKEVYLITDEIKKINERKKDALYNAMENNDKWLSTKVKKSKTFERITKFFASRINAPKVIKKSLIDPLTERIEYFIENELATMK